ncbi:hypothetical protein BH11ACT8_BH11ACT8_21880 [soil metagenome]
MPRTVARALARAALALLTAGSLLVMAGPAPAAPPGSPSATRADAGTPLTRFTVIDHNIEHNPAALRLAIRQAASAKAQAITLQEVCWWQARDLRRRHPGWTVAWTEERAVRSCEEDRGPLLPRDKRRTLGNVAIWTGGSSGVTSVQRFHNQYRKFNQGMACVTYRAGARTRLCSVHLISASKPAARRRIRVRQAREVHRLTSRWVVRDDLVVLGGDFNNPPYRSALDFIYAFRGQGSFREATPCPRRNRDCRGSEVTFDGGRTKIDYVFFSANRMSGTAARHLRVVKTPSDHHLLRAWAYVDTRAH